MGQTKNQGVNMTKQDKIFQAKKNIQELTAQWNETKSDHLLKLINAWENFAQKNLDGKVGA